MIVVGRRGCQRLPAPRALYASRCCDTWDSRGAVHPPNVNGHVGFHGACVVAGRAAPHDAVCSRMSLEAMLDESALLDERLSAPGFCTGVIQSPSVFLDMIEHGVLTCLCFITVGTDIEPRGIHEILRLGGDRDGSRHSSWCQRRPDCRRRRYVKFLARRCRRLRIRRLPPTLPANVVLSAVFVL